MRYVGGLTYPDNSHGGHLQVPNYVASQRFVKAVFERYHLRVEDIDSALQAIATSGNILPLLEFYQRLMSERDVGHSDFERTEDQHRDSLHIALFNYPILKKDLEFQITKVKKGHICERKAFSLLFNSPSLHIHRRIKQMDESICWSQR